MEISQFVKSYNYIFENKEMNPDDFKSDDMDKKGDDYEKKQDEIRKFFSQKDKNNNKPISEEETETTPEKDEVKEAMSIDDILRKHEERKNAEKSAGASQDGTPSEGSMITEIIVNEMYDGYVNATVIRSDTSREDIELEIPQEDIDKMFTKLEAKSKDDDVVSPEDACAACVYLQVEKNVDEKKTIKWFFGKNKHDIGDWKFYDDLDASMAQDLRDDSYQSIWNTGRSNGSYNDLDIGNHDDDL